MTEGHAEHGDRLSSLYAFQRRWFDDVLARQDSMLTPGRAVWTPAHLDELQRGFVERPDTTHDRTFLDKLQLQLTDVSSGAKQLMAELLLEHFLIFWIGAISQTSKVRTVEAVLSWMDEPPAISDEVLAVLSPGVVHPGQWALTRRDLQLRWLIEFSQAFLRLPDARREQLRDDPWALRDFTDPMTALSTENARLALLHLNFPATFEAIVSPRHKQAIIERFADVPGVETDADRRLSELRAALGGPELDWYAEPFVRRWHKDGKAWSTLLDWTRRIHQDPQLRAEERPYKLSLATRLAEVRRQCLDGDESWSAALRSVLSDRRANNLTRWQDDQPLLDWLDADPDRARRLLTLLWDPQVDSTAALRAFVDGIPESVLAAAPGVRLNLGSVLLMACGAEQHPPLKISVVRAAWTLAGWPPDKNLGAVAVYARALVMFEELVRDSRDWPAPLADLLDAQGALWTLVTYGDRPAGWADQEWAALRAFRGDAPDEAAEPSQADDEAAGAARAEVGVDRIGAAARELLVDRSFLDEIVQLVEDKKRQVIFYGPPGTGKTYVAQRLALAMADGSPERVRLVQFHPATSYEDFVEGLRPRVDSEGRLAYEVRPGPLLLACQAAEEDASGADHVLVVDEINRANLPKVLGELLYLLEYRDEKTTLLHRPDRPFSLPRNLVVIGTMNTADRSIARIDAALRRRFHFVPFFPHEGPMRGLLGRWLEGRGRLGIARLLDAVNDELIAAFGGAVVIGPSYFMQDDLSDTALRRIWDYNIFPLVEDHLWDRPDTLLQWSWDAVRARYGELLG